MNECIIIIIIIIAFVFGNMIFLCSSASRAQAFQASTLQCLSQSAGLNSLNPRYMQCFLFFKKLCLVLLCFLKEKSAIHNSSYTTQVSHIHFKCFFPVFFIPEYLPLSSSLKTLTNSRIKCMPFIKTSTAGVLFEDSVYLESSYTFLETVLSRRQCSIVR